MRLFAMLSLLMICGCTTQKTEMMSCTSEPETTAPVVLEADILEETGRNTHPFYKIRPLHVIKNESLHSLDRGDINVMSKNDMKLNMTYLLELEYIDEAHPSHGLVIVKAKMK